MSSKRLSDLISNIRVTIRRCLYLDWDISPRVPARRKEVGMNNDMPCARSNQLRVTFRDGWAGDFEKRGDNEWKLSSFADPQRGQPYVLVSLFAPAAVSHHQYRCHAGCTHFSLSSSCGWKGQKITPAWFVRVGGGKPN